MRKSWDDYFLDIAKVVASRSPCLKAQVGAVLIDPDTKAILATGYNGPVRGAPHCEECARSDSASGWDYDQCPAIHAELNAIIASARNGVSITDSILYITRMPCYTCAKAIINAGIIAVVLENLDAVSPKVVNFLEKNSVLVRIGSVSDGVC